ncbi:MAG: hypothetical protein JW822_06525 [Spirochaetales bacterium]|nr:hypothetical protein [Spirochaetales bacterium]
MTSAKKKQTRRTFFKNLGRGVLAAGLALLGFKLLGKSLFIKKKAQSCNADFICSRCSVFSSCGLPPALSRKRAQSLITPAPSRKGG